MESLRILIVDDEEELASALAERLAIRGYEVEIATNGEDALTAHCERDFDVLIVDVKMPGIGGPDLMATILRDTPDLPVILFTGHGSVAEAEQGIKKGAYDYVMKPVDIDVLVEKIRSAATWAEGGAS
jgi:DNA-binding NtrC family response regulator